jgi:hypothetical protein
VSTQRLTATSFGNRIGQERWERYCAACPIGDFERARRLYEWNARVAGGLLELLAHTEVVIRNAIAGSLTAAVQTEARAGEWYEQDDWFLPRSRESIADARDRLARMRRPETSGSVLSELDLGFWRYLLDRSNHASLWVPYLRFAFRSSNGRRQTVYDRIDKLHRLRNRVAHHETVFGRDLPADEAMCVEVVSWVDPGLGPWLRSTSRLRRIAELDPR